MNTITNIKPLLILSLVLLLGSNSNIAQNVGIGSSSFTPDPSAVLELQSSQQGFLPPRMTTEQRDLIIEPAEGLMIYNTTTKCIEYFAYDIWQSFNCAVCPTPNPPTVDTHIPSETQIVWNWNVVAAATGYKWHTANNYAAAIDLGNLTTVTQTGLTCNSQYTIYVWAYNACGEKSNTLIMSENTINCAGGCATSVTFAYNGQQVTYGIVESETGRCWLDRNLGATRIAEESQDHLSYGDLFQWGRAADGHQLISWSCGAWPPYPQPSCGTPVNGTTSNLSNSDQPGHGSFITINTNPYDWRSPANNSLWQGLSGINNPCPSGWRLPTMSEWNEEINTWIVEHDEDMWCDLYADAAISSPLRLPLPGYRHSAQSETLYIPAGSGGFYWASDIYAGSGHPSDPPKSYNIWFNQCNLSNQITYRAYGLSVRCIQE